MEEKTKKPIPLTQMRKENLEIDGKKRISNVGKMISIC